MPRTDDNSINVPTHTVVPEGWLPIAVGGRYLTVRWLRVEQETLSEPFFVSSIALLRARAPSPLECETDIEVLIQESGRLSPIEPVGLIVHMTRCGSTAVVNALRNADDTVVLSEAPPIEKVLHLAVSKSQFWGDTGMSLLSPTVAAFARYQGAEPKKVVIKCGIEGSGFLPIFRAKWPHVPVLILIRDPLEVMVSNIQKPAQWFRSLRTSSPAPAGSPAENAPRRAEWIERGVQAIGRICSDMVQHMYDSCIVMDSADMSPARIHRVAESFGLQFSIEGEAEFLRSLSRYSKNMKQPFEDDTERKQRAADEHLRTSVAQWIAEPYRVLKQRAVGRNGAPKEDKI